MPYITASLLLVVGLLSVHIHHLQGRLDALTDRFLATKDASVSLATKASGELLQQVSDAVAQQVSVLQESVKVAWSPQPPPQTPNQGEFIRQLSEKYHLPVQYGGLSETDLGDDPTDRYLHDDYQATHQGSVMLADTNDPLDSDEPFGVPGLKVIV